MVFWSSCESLSAVCTLAAFETISELSSRHFLISRFSESWDCAREKGRRARVRTAACRRFGAWRVASSSTGDGRVARACCKRCMEGCQGMLQAVHDGLGGQRVGTGGLGGRRWHWRAGRAARLLEGAVQLLVLLTEALEALVANLRRRGGYTHEDGESHASAPVVHREVLPADGRCERCDGLRVLVVCRDSELARPTPGAMVGASQAALAELDRPPQPRWRVKATSAGTRAVGAAGRRTSSVKTSWKSLSSVSKALASKPRSAKLSFCASRLLSAAAIAPACEEATGAPQASAWLEGLLRGGYASQAELLSKSIRVVFPSYFGGNSPILALLKI